MVSIMDVILGMVAGWVMVSVWFMIKIYLFAKDMNKRAKSGFELNEKLNPKPVVVK